MASTAGVAERARAIGRAIAQQTAGHTCIVVKQTLQTLYLFVVKVIWRVMHRQRMRWRAIQRWTGLPRHDLVENPPGATPTGHPTRPSTSPRS